MSERTCFDFYPREGDGEYAGYLLSDRDLEFFHFVTRGEHPVYGDGWWAYAGPISSHIAWETHEVLPLLDTIEQMAEAGRYAAGFVSFDAATAFDSALVSHREKGWPLASFMVYETAPRFYKELAFTRPPERVPGDWKPEIDRDQYLSQFRHVKERLANGDTYQVNLTLRFLADDQIPPFYLLSGLASEVPPAYACWYWNRPVEMVSLSPELFFQRDGSHIRCKPMKGTAPVGLTPAETRSNAESLKSSEKDRAENLMIVDMVRNDLGRIAEIGSVKVTSMFEVEESPTVLQMTSTVEAEVKRPLSEIFQALFPCASIVGAPKVESMKIIHGLEKSHRGVYTGAIGTVSPGGKARFSVAIRTVSCWYGSKSRTYGAGSGIVWDSDGESEWNEILLKTEILRRPNPQWRLLETFKWPDDVDEPRIPRHLDRMKRSANEVGLYFSSEEALKLLSRATKNVVDPVRVRLLYGEGYEIEIEVEPLQATPDEIEASITATPVLSTDPSLRIKSNRRKPYTRRLQEAGTEEVILWNERGEATEFCKGNLVIRVDGQFFTPPLESGLLPGVLREILLEAGEIAERTISVDEVRDAKELWRINSLTGWVPIRIIKDETESQKDVD